MNTFLIFIQFHILQFAAGAIAIFLLIRHRQRIGRRCAGYGIAGIALLLLDRAGTAVLYNYLASAASRDFDREMTQRIVIGIGSSLIEALGIWLLFIGVSNRRILKDA